jgi:hypothetical protein
MPCPQIVDAGNLFDTEGAVDMVKKQLLTTDNLGLDTGLKTM